MAMSPSSFFWLAFFRIFSSTVRSDTNLGGQGTEVLHHHTQSVLSHAENVFANFFGGEGDLKVQPPHSMTWVCAQLEATYCPLHVKLNEVTRQRQAHHPGQLLFPESVTVIKS